jgi:integrase
VLVNGTTDIHIMMNLKWSKTNQHMDKQPLVPIPAVPDSVVDPVRSFVKMTVDTPTILDNETLLHVPATGGRRALTVNHLRACLRHLLAACGIDPSLYSLHSFRRGGATTAYQAEASQHDIQTHGGLKSQAFWEYIHTLPRDSSVPAALAAASNRE